MMIRMLIATSALALVGACDQLTLEPPKANSAPAQEAVPVLDVRPFAGSTYAEFLAREGAGRYDVAAMGLSDPERARFDAGMADATPAFLARGGGAEALVFKGCAVSGCAHGRAVLAVDVQTGAMFVGVSGGGGEEKLVPNDRLEALLRVTSATMRWDDPAPPAPLTGTPPATPPVTPPVTP